MKILIYGGGAVGLGLASCFLKSKETVDIIARPKTTAALRKYGLIRKGIFGFFRASAENFEAYPSLRHLPNGTYDFILVTTKSFDSESAAKDLSRHKKIFYQKTKIVLCQNGWGNAEIFCRYFSKKKVYNARVITGFIRPKPNVVTITVHADSVKVGSLFHASLDSLKPLAQAISDGGLPCRVVKDVEKDLWAKILYNCALNSLGAIFEVPYGVLGEQDFTRSLMNDIIKEAFAVMRRAGYRTHWPSARAYLKVFYKKFLPSTAKHNSSTLQDIKAKKKTEIDALNGMVIKLADRLKIPVPTNRNVYQAVKFIEARNFSASRL